MSYEEALKLACKDEKAFLEVVQKDAENIPASVKFFLADKIREVLVGMKDQKRATVISETLSSVGI